MREDVNMGVASLVLGIIAIIFGAVGVLPVGLICGIIGIILGALGRSNPQKAGIATGGLVCSIIGTALSILFYAACYGCAACGEAAIRSSLGL